MIIAVHDAHHIMKRNIGSKTYSEQKTAEDA